MKILHFADLHLGVENYGRIDPETGLSSRLRDFLSALDRVVDYALENSVDLVLFCGDAYKTREPSQTQQREFARRINRLSNSGIPVFLLVGNHDLHNAIGRATSTEIFDTLAVRNVYVSNRPEIYHVTTKSGDIQIATLPWLRRSAMLAKEEARNLNLEQIKARMQEVLTNIVAAHAAQLDPALPSIMAAHVWVSGAQVGSERLMAIGQEPGLLVSNVASPAFDYVALGHIHRHQVLSTSPPVTYAGSLERLDFGDEDDEKGFYVIDIDLQPDGRSVSFDFHPVKARRFISIDVALEPEDADPTATTLKAIAAQGDGVKEAIVRLNLKVPVQLEGYLRDGDVREALKEAHYFAVARDVQREARLRLGEWAAEEITPLEALKAFLESKKSSPERTKVLLECGEKLIRGEGVEKD